MLLSGNLGAGKTTFTQFLGEALGVEGRITSPTYTLVGEYPVRGNADIRGLIHIDLYRTQEGQKSNALNNEYIHEILQGAQEHKAVIIIEWGELLSKELLTGHVWSVDIAYVGTGNGRRVSVRSSKT